MGDWTPLHRFLEWVESTMGNLVQPHLFENLYAKGAFWLTIHPRKATKAHGLKAMLEHADLRDAHCVVYGDQLNDVEMFRFAQESVAVANANDELKAIANRNIGANTSDSVIRDILAMAT